MNQITVYTTDSCGYCTRVKSLLQKRSIEFEEINLSKDPVGRAQLAERTGNLTFPQIMIDGDVLGGYREMLLAELAGHLDALGEN